MQHIAFHMASSVSLHAFPTTRSPTVGSPRTYIDWLGLLCPPYLLTGTETPKEEYRSQDESNDRNDHPHLYNGCLLIHTLLSIKPP